MRNPACLSKIEAYTWFASDLDERLMCGVDRVMLSLGEFRKRASKDSDAHVRIALWTPDVLGGRRAMMHADYPAGSSVVRNEKIVH